MKIIRDNQVIELTKEELIDAHKEQQHIYDMEEIKKELKYLTTTQSTKEYYAKKILESEYKISTLAYDKRRSMNRYGMGSKVATEEAIDKEINHWAMYDREANL